MILNIIIAIIMIGLIVLIHEFGHFIVAKANGVAVVEFSIGFGPKLFGIKKGDTIGIVAPSGPFRATTLGEIENALNDLGYNVKFGESCYGSYKGYLSSEDDIRAKDIEDMNRLYGIGGDE